MSTVSLLGLADPHGGHLDRRRLGLKSGTLPSRPGGRGPSTRPTHRARTAGGRRGLGPGEWWVRGGVLSALHPCTRREPGECQAKGARGGESPLCAAPLHTPGSHPASQSASRAGTPGGPSPAPHHRPRDWVPGQGSRLDYPLPRCCPLGVPASVGETPQFKSHLPRPSLSEVCRDFLLYPSLSLTHPRPPGDPG